MRSPDCDAAAKELGFENMNKYPYRFLKNQKVVFGL